MRRDVQRYKLTKRVDLQLINITFSTGRHEKNQLKTRWTVKHQTETVRTFNGSRPGRLHKSLYSINLANGHPHSTAENRIPNPYFQQRLSQDNG